MPFYITPGSLCDLTQGLATGLHEAPSSGFGFEQAPVPAALASVVMQQAFRHQAARRRADQQAGALTRTQVKERAEQWTRRWTARYGRKPPEWVDSCDDCGGKPTVVCCV